MTKCAPQIDRCRNSAIAGLAALLFSATQLFGGQGEGIPISRPLTLYDCISLALNESPLLEASRLDVASATEDARAARAQALPQINALASYQLFTGSPTNKFSIVNVGTTGGLGVSHNVEQGAVELYSAHLSYPLFRD